MGEASKDLSISGNYMVITTTHRKGYSLVYFFSLFLDLNYSAGI